MPGLMRYDLERFLVAEHVFAAFRPHVIRRMLRGLYRLFALDYLAIGNYRIRFPLREGLAHAVWKTRPVVGRLDEGVVGPAGDIQSSSHPAECRCRSPLAK